LRYQTAIMKLCFIKLHPFLLQDHMFYFLTCDCDKQEKYKDVEPSGIDFLKEMHCNKKKGFSENVEKAI
ncbi:hypothetical protein ACJX0J_041942, partial [Zea mays]